MSDKIIISVENRGDQLHVDVVFREPKLVGLNCKLTVEMFVETLQSNGTDKRKTVLTEPFKADAAGNRFVIPTADIKGFGHSGQHIRITPQLVVTVDDGVLWDTKERVEFDLPLPARSVEGVASGTPSQVLNPTDQISFARNFSALPVQQKMLLSLLLLVFVVGAVFLLLVSLHDQFSESSILFPDEWDVPPVIIGIVGAVVSIFVLVFFYKGLLRGYMSAQLSQHFPMIGPGVKLRVSDLFEATARTSLTGVQVRVVAGSLECGEYVQRSGTDTSYIAFRRPVKAVVLYEKMTAAVHANVDLQQYFADDIDFAPMFAALPPPAMYSNRHGLEVQLKLQILVPDLADFELVIPSDRIDGRGFLQSV
ncbi:MAG: hypothetical protein AAGH82_07095 [Pseudomonadota bacterium]